MIDHSGLDSPTLSPVESLLWLCASLGQPHREILVALLGMADADGKVVPDEAGSIYQHAALQADRSPGYSNRVLNELVWYGLIRANKTKVKLANGKTRLMECYRIVGFEHYRHWAVQCVLNAEHIKGRSEKASQPDWTERLNAIV